MGRPMFLFWIMLILTPISLYYRVIDPRRFFSCLVFLLVTFSSAVFTALPLPPCRNWCRHRYAAPWWPLHIVLEFFGLGLGVTGGIVVDWMIAEAI